MKKLAEFFQDKDNCLSMSRLLAFMSFFPATYVIWHHGADLRWYVGAYATAYVGGKVADAFN